MENQSNGLDFNAMPMKKKALLIAAGVGLISCFLPLLSFMGFSISLISAGGLGYLILLGFIEVIVLSLFFDKMGMDEEKANKIIKFSIIGVAAIWAINIIRVFSSGGAIGFSFGMFGIGFYLITLALVAILLIYFDVIKLDKE